MQLGALPLVLLTGLGAQADARSAHLTAAVSVASGASGGGEIPAGLGMPARKDVIADAQRIGAH
jgi:hypothetical protein